MTWTSASTPPMWTGARNWRPRAGKLLRTRMGSCGKGARATTRCTTAPQTTTTWTFLPSPPGPARWCVRRPGTPHTGKTLIFLSIFWGPFPQFSSLGCRPRPPTMSGTSWSTSSGQGWWRALSTPTLSSYWHSMCPSLLPSNPQIGSFLKKGQHSNFLIIHLFLPIKYIFLFRIKDTVPDLLSVLLNFIALLWF